MKLDRINKDSVRSTEQVGRRVTTLSPKELTSVVAGIEACNCPYSYGSTEQQIGTAFRG